MNNQFKAQSLNRKSYRKFTLSYFSVTCYRHVELLWPISALDRKQVRGYATNITLQLWMYVLGASCRMPVLGDHPNGFGAWDERDLALVNGPITAVKVWTNNCGIEGYERRCRRATAYFFQHLVISYQWLSNSSVWHKGCCYLIRRT